ncbi:hypothetical protein [Bordetella hinzii]|uniref:Uncharacterized protein n=2 Tax=Bordetella hinzii TaxID=103855 RepID=A0AAN1RXI9_9BORD|nr:hypothetical protein [Bordetella hinzii]AKQ56722.1 hypothetical protein ACR54_03422 [Bordetella hinzii]AKQ61182.1 hypothetical protein ACR55_03332 [Bordetella hinzii]AZW17824.1 hypothetical protein CS347_14165 [Bordetella hinzii]KCB22043.1 hypothetical protein L544_2277 [Bordetella hinzii OH87 BAL007II]KCB30884.1 hypothetical protein L543_2503 [Bordetella hinzii L60]
MHQLHTLLISPEQARAAARVWGHKNAQQASQCEFLAVSWYDLQGDPNDRLWSRLVAYLCRVLLPRIASNARSQADPQGRARPAIAASRPPLPLLTLSS